MDRLARSVVDLDRLVSELTRQGVTVRFLKEGLAFEATARADPLAVSSRSSAPSPSSSAH